MTAFLILSWLRMLVRSYSVPSMLRPAGRRNRGLGSNFTTILDITPHNAAPIIPICCVGPAKIICGA